MTATATHTRAFRDWSARVESGVFTRGHVRQWYNRIARTHLDLMPHGAKSALTPDECDELVAMLRARDGVRLTDEHTEQGLGWLKRNARRVFGPEFPLDHVTEHFSHFLYRGEILTYGAHNNGTLPVWTIVLTNGGEIDYHNAAWQGAHYEKDGTANGWEWKKLPDDFEEIPDFQSFCDENDLDPATTYAEALYEAFSDELRELDV